MDLKERINETFDKNRKINLLVKEQCFPSILELINSAKKTMKRNGKIILFGNGGSAADAQHIAAEFMGKFKNKKRLLGSSSTIRNPTTKLDSSHRFSVDILEKSFDVYERLNKVSI